MDLHERAVQLAQLLEERLDIRGSGLATKVRRAGRRLPRWVRRELGALVEALEFADTPKLAARIDHARIDAGTRKVEAWLKSIDPWDRRKGILLNWLGGNALNILGVGALFVAVLAWRGFL